MSEAINEKMTSEARPTPPPSDGVLASGGALGLSYALEYVGFVNAINDLYPELWHVATNQKLADIVESSE